MEEILDDPDYWLEKALQRVQCGRRNEVGVFLATQLRDNRVPKRTAEETMKRYARETPRCGGDDYTGREALSTLKSVYRTDRRDPATVESDDGGTDRLEERARERERELLDQFRQDPSSLSDKERKRLEYSSVSNGLSLKLEEIEMAKDWMTDVELGIYKHTCPSHRRRYQVDLDSDCLDECDHFDVFVTDRGYKFAETSIDNEDSKALEEIVENIIERALDRRSKYID